MLLLLALITIPVSIASLQATSFGGWPAVGFSVALFLVAGRELRWMVLGAQLVVMSVALSFSYDVALPLGAAGRPDGHPAGAVHRPHAPGRGRRLRLDEVDNVRYHAVTAASGLLCGIAAAPWSRSGWTPTTPRSRA